MRKRFGVKSTLGIMPGRATYVIDRAASSGTSSSRSCGPASTSKRPSASFERSRSGCGETTRPGLSAGAKSALACRRLSSIGRVGRTIAFGDIHGDLEGLERVFSKLPRLEKGDTLVFLGDYVDRGPRSAQVIEFVREPAERRPARVIALRGNHEDAWLRVIERGWPEFVLPTGNGCLAAMRSFTGGPRAEPDEKPKPGEEKGLISGTSSPPRSSTG